MSFCIEYNVQNYETLGKKLHAHCAKCGWNAKKCADGCSVRVSVAKVGMLGKNV